MIFILKYMQEGSFTKINGAVAGYTSVTISIVLNFSMLLVSITMIL